MGRNLVWVPTFHGCCCCDDKRPEKLSLVKITCHWQGKSDPSVLVIGTRERSVEKGGHKVSLGLDKLTFSGQKMSKLNATPG